MKHKLIICISALCLGLAGNVQAQNKKMYRNGWIDFNKNGVKDIYEDPSQPVEKRVADLLSQMSVEEKTCQLATLYGYGRVLKGFPARCRLEKRNMERRHCQYR